MNVDVYEIYYAILTLECAVVLSMNNVAAIPDDETKMRFVSQILQKEIMYLNRNMFSVPPVSSRLENVFSSVISRYL